MIFEWIINITTARAWKTSLVSSEILKYTCELIQKTKFKPQNVYICKINANWVGCHIWQIPLYSRSECNKFICAWTHILHQPFLQQFVHMFKLCSLHRYSCCILLSLVIELTRWIISKPRCLASNDLKTLYPMSKLMHGEGPIIHTASVPS